MHLRESSFQEPLHQKCRYLHQSFVKHCEDSKLLQCDLPDQYWGTKMDSKFNIEYIYGKCLKKTYSQRLQCNNLWYNYANILNSVDSKLLKSWPPRPLLGSRRGSKVNIEICRENKIFFWELQCYNLRCYYAIILKECGF